MGWGREEMIGYYYWGGKMDLESELRALGYNVYTVSVGPISPNWDRAIEVFYQIKGGQVDYGNEKAQKYNIKQTPAEKNYPGLYPQWDSDHPIHIISHSMGGQTARMLELLLKTSITAENSPLLTNEYTGWIKSITTISAPHNGSTLVPIMLDIFPFALNLAPWFGGIENSTLNNLFNFDLDHWGLEKLENEPFNDYFQRLSSSPINDTKNLCSWDLSPDGADEFNKIYGVDSSVYYFSFETYATKQNHQKKFHKPDSEMSLHLWATGILIGKYENSIDSTWYENDGICNTISMSHPNGTSMKIFDGNPITGIWQMTGKLHMDHQGVIGHAVNKKKLQTVFALYKKHCNLLYSLP